MILKRILGGTCFVIGGILTFTLLLMPTSVKIPYDNTTTFLVCLLAGPSLIYLAWKLLI
ncbi:MAG: hypothetical protein ISS48_04525 [Candidatus Aenigmarchaeota archaeon]|nr:hypothetical protein [Candidatus Aenigmarchaeota archaeon]